MFVVKLSTDLSHQASKRYVLNQDVQGYGIAAHNGLVYVVGRYGSKSLICAFNASNLSLTNEILYSTAINSRFHSVAVSSDGAVYAAGYITTGSDTFPLVVKYSANLSIEARTELYAAGGSHIRDIVATPDGRVAVTGYANLNGLVGVMGFVADLDASLALSGARLIDNADYVFMDDICCDNDGNLIAVGQVRGIIGSADNAFVVYMPDRVSAIDVVTFTDLTPLDWRASSFVSRSTIGSELSVALGSVALTTDVLDASTVSYDPNLGLTYNLTEY